MHKQITILGLGRMGLAMATLLVEKGYIVHGYDPSEIARREAEQNGIATYTSSTAAIAAQDVSNRVIWLMVPAKLVDTLLLEITPVLEARDCIIDGGNSFYKDSVRRHQELQSNNIAFLDCGTSGGVTGARTGASLMVGGKIEIFTMYEQLFKDLAAEDGYARVGESGAGHFVKMVHNGIEYGMMGAIAEGMNAIQEHATEFSIDTKAVLRPYEHNSIITSNLVSWLADALRQPDYMNSITGEVPIGETESEMEHLTTIATVPILKAALVQRESTRINPSYTGKLIAAMRNQFGGHKTINRE